MDYRILYRLMICLALPLLAAGCTKELPDDPEPPVEEEPMTRIVFNTSNFTKADIRSPKDEDGIRTIDLYAFVWGHNEYTSTQKIINFSYQHVDNNDTLLIPSKFFVKNDIRDVATHTNLYAIANQEDKMLLGGLDTKSSFSDYVIAVKNNMEVLSINITADQENALKNVLVQVDNLNTKQEYPYLAKTVTVEGGASIVTIPLERLYCRVYFSFLLTGNTTDEIQINTIMLGKTVSSGYLFLEQNSSASGGGTPLTWSSEYSSDVFMDTFGNVVNQPLHPGGTMLTLCNGSDHSPIYFRSYQSLRDDLTNAPEIWLTITSNGGRPRRLTAPLYSTSGMDGKFYYGFMRNHTYHVISTINASTLKLENVTVQMHDWIDRGEVEIPGFE